MKLAVERATKVRGGRFCSAAAHSTTPTKRGGTNSAAAAAEARNNGAVAIVGRQLATSACVSGVAVLGLPRFGAAVLASASVSFVHRLHLKRLPAAKVKCSASNGHTKPFC